MWLGMAKVRGGARTQAGKKKNKKTQKKNRFPIAQGHVDSSGICTPNGLRVTSVTSLSESPELQGPTPEPSSDTGAENIV